MGSLNKVQLIGNLGDDPESKYMSSGSAIATLSIATNEKWKDKETGQDKERTEWHRVTFFGRTAEVCTEYLHKGDQVYIEGSLKYDKVTDDDGKDKYYTNINGRKLVMLGAPKSGTRTGGGPSPSENRAQKELRTDQGKAASADSVNDGAQQEFDDDIPF